MNRFQIREGDVETFQKVDEKNISEVYKIILKKSNECWYEKFVRLNYYEKIFPFDVYEKFASDVAKLLDIKTNDAMLVIDNSSIGKGRMAVIIKSFLEGKDQFVEAHTFLKQYKFAQCEICDSMELYFTLTNSFNKKYAVSNNAIDLDFLYCEIAKFLIAENKRSGASASIENLLKDFSKIIFLDYLLGNSDRSAKNWGLIYKESGKITLTPSFDNTNIFSPKYVHIHGLNITPQALIEYLIRYRYNDICETMHMLYKITDSTLTNLLMSYDECKDVLDINFINDFILSRIELAYKIEKEYIN